MTTYQESPEEQADIVRGLLSKYLGVPLAMLEDPDLQADIHDIAGLIGRASL
jgi:hypothetical protein